MGERIHPQDTASKSSVRIEKAQPSTGEQQRNLYLFGPALSRVEPLQLHLACRMRLGDKVPPTLAREPATYGLKLEAVPPCGVPMAGLRVPAPLHQEPLDSRRVGSMCPQAEMRSAILDRAHAFRARRRSPDDHPAYAAAP
jgi:hypothetical protein